MLRMNTGIKKYGFTEAAKVIEPITDRILCVASRMDFGKNSSTALKSNENFKYSVIRKEANERSDTEIITYFSPVKSICVNISPNISWKSIQNSPQWIRIEKTHRRGNDALEHRIVNILRATHTHHIETNWSKIEQKSVRKRKKNCIIAEIPWNANNKNGNDQRRLDSNAHFCTQCKRRIFIRWYWFIIRILCVIFLKKYSSFFLFCPKNKRQKIILINFIQFE